MSELEQFRSLQSVFLLAFSVLTLGCNPGKKEPPRSITFIVEAREALSKGETEKAMEALTSSIESQPNVWAYYERAKLHLKKGDEEAASSDCKMALDLDPDHGDVKWLQKEIQKPEARRFKGQYKMPPSFRK